MYEWYAVLSDFGKLLLAAVIGGAIGFERESHGQAAGFRTYLIVSAGACLMMLLSLHMEDLFRHLNANAVVRLDPGRIASYAIASMGFLGAGAIIKGKVVTGMGLAIGAGHIYQTIFTTIIILVALYWLQPIRKLARRRYYRILTVMYKGDKEQIDDIKNIISGFTSFYIQNVNYEHDLLTQTTTYRIRLYSKGEGHWKEVLKEIKPIEGILLLKWEESDVP